MSDVAKVAVAAIAAVALFGVGYLIYRQTQIPVMGNAPTGKVTAVAPGNNPLAVIQQSIPVIAAATNLGASIGSRFVNSNSGGTDTLDDAGADSVDEGD